MIIGRSIISYLEESDFEMAHFMPMFGGNPRQHLAKGHDIFNGEDDGFRDVTTDEAWFASYHWSAFLLYDFTTIARLIRRYKDVKETDF